MFTDRLKNLLHRHFLAWMATSGRRRRCSVCDYDDDEVDKWTSSSSSYSRNRAPAVAKHNNGGFGYNTFQTRSQSRERTEKNRKKCFPISMQTHNHSAQLGSGGVYVDE